MESLKEKESVLKRSNYKPIITCIVVLLIVFIVFLIVNFTLSENSENVYIMAPTEDYNSSKYLEEENNNLV